MHTTPSGLLSLRSRIELSLEVFGSSRGLTKYFAHYTKLFKVFPNHNTDASPWKKQWRQGHMSRLGRLDPEPQPGKRGREKETTAHFLEVPLSRDDSWPIRESEWACKTPSPVQITGVHEVPLRHVRPSAQPEGRCSVGWASTTVFHFFILLIKCRFCIIGVAKVIQSSKVADKHSYPEWLWCAWCCDGVCAV